MDRYRFYWTLSPSNGPSISRTNDVDYDGTNSVVLFHNGFQLIWITPSKSNWTNLPPSIASTGVEQEYQLTVKLQAFTAPGGTVINRADILADLSLFRKLVAGDIEFQHRVTLPADSTIKEDLQIGKTEGAFSYRVANAKEGKIRVEVSTTLSEVAGVMDGVPVKSSRSAKTTFECMLGEEIPLALGETGVQSSHSIILFTITVTK